MKNRLDRGLTLVEWLRDVKYAPKSRLTVLHLSPSFPVDIVTKPRESVKDCCP